MNLVSLNNECILKAYQVSVQLFPQPDHNIGYYNCRELASKVAKVCNKHQGLISQQWLIISKPCKKRVMKISAEWCLKEDSTKKIESLFDEEKIRVFLDDLTGFRRITSKRKVDQEPEVDTNLKRKKIDHEAELRNLGFCFTGKKSLQRAYRKWARGNHPDKKPEGLERESADSRFRTMKKHYDAVLEMRGWKG